MVLKSRPLPNRLRVVRVERNATQAKLARASKVSQTRISLLERGMLQPTPAERDALARVLGVTPSDIWQAAS